MFEKLRLAAAKGEVPVQRLLVPQVVELSAADARAAASLLPLLAKTGLEAEPFGERSVVIRAVPAALARLDGGKLLKDAIDEIAVQGRSGTIADRTDDVFARMACHAAVRAGDVLSSEEVARLLADMDGIDFAANCPHGRPVVVRFPVAEVEKWFERR
jgi:DNA mismatch repair protein MutL